MIAGETCINKYRTWLSCQKIRLPHISGNFEKAIFLKNLVEKKQLC